MEYSYVHIIKFSYGLHSPIKLIPSGWVAHICIISEPIFFTWCHMGSRLHSPPNWFVMYNVVPGCTWTT